MKRPSRPRRAASSATRTTASAASLARYTQRIGKLYGKGHEVVLEYRPDRFLRGGDHTPFNQQGFAAVRFTEMNEDYTHQHQDLRTEKGRAYGDVIEGVDFAYLRRNAGINLATMASLALAPAAPAKVEVLTANLTNRTEPALAGPGHRRQARGLRGAGARNQFPSGSSASP
ncbi:hypothetical protein ACFQT0_14335 [Hymenobacter humi]|uniref:Peptidase M28 domain-containing protein n=1 Tax=Hymenobacter humi TaxID=1411620 RepID=A0ABW2U7T4_9BACT